MTNLPGSPEGEAQRAARSRVNVSRALALVVVLLAVSAELLLRRSAGPEFVFLGFGLAIATAALAGGPRVGAAAIAAAVLASDYFLLEPGTFLSLGSRIAAGALAAFVVGWTLVCVLIHRLHAAARDDREARSAAEHSAAQANRLAPLTAALGLARSPDAVMDAAVQEALHALRADAAMLLLVRDDAGVAAIVRAVGYESAPGVADIEPALRTGPLRDAIRRAAPVILESPAERAREYGETADDIVGDPYAALAAVPLVIGGRVAAVIRLEFREPRAFTPDDDKYLATLAAHAAHALERTREQESDQRARIEAEDLRERADQELARRQAFERALRASETRYRALATRTTRLHELTAALSEAVTTRAVATAIVQHATIVVGATAGDVWLLTEDGAQFETFSSAAPAAAEPERIPVEPGLCETEVLGTRQPLFIPSWEQSQERYWRSASAAADAAYASSTALPLLVAGAPAGVLRFDFSVPVNFDDDYRALLISVAQHCSQALDRARLYESAQRARTEAEAASRLKDDFLSIVSHELRTPLNAVLGWASMLQKTSLDSTLARRAVQSISENATRQARLIDDLLDVSRIAAGRATLDLQEIDLATLVGGVAESLIPVAASNHVDLRLEPLPPAPIHGDRRRLEQVFFNLIGNALKFTPKGGWIRIDASLAEQTVQVHVRDSGIGIDPDFLPHVFERFRQADSTSTRTYGGLGLGLSIAKQLVEAHKGRIAVESAGREQGAAFTVELPLTGVPQTWPPPAEPAAPPAPTDVPSLHGTRVLVVDDEPDAREIMTYTLKECGASVTSAATAAEAYDLLASDRFDVLLADIAMPGEDGCSLMRRVRSSGNPRVAVIPAAAVTAHAREDERRDVLAAGFNLHLAKPLEPAELARAVGELGRGRSGLSLAGQ